MPNLDIANSTASDMENNVDAVTVASLSVDGVQDQEETEWICSKWEQYWGYFNSIAELKSALVQKAIWNVGKGYTADPETTVILDHISGDGKTTFEDILFSMDITKRVGGDAYAEIIRDPKTNLLINLKLLDTGSIKVIYGSDGRIKRYEQINKTPKNKTGVIKFQPDEIFHLSNNKMVGQVHGISDIDAIENTILAENESFVNMKKIMARQAKPMIMFKLGTDNQAKIDAFVAKMDAATNKGENIYIPDDENSVSFEVVQVNVNPIVLEWRNDLRKKFYRAIGLPELLPSGGGDATESGGKIGYLCFQQIVEREQRYIENQVWQQLALRINLIPPATLAPALSSDTSKDGAMAGLNMQPSDMIAGAGR